MYKLQQLMSLYLDLMTTAPKVELTENLFRATIIFQFMFRLHYLLPEDGWGIWNYEDFKIKIPQQILSTIFQQNAILLKVILIILNGCCLLMSFMRIKLMYYYNNVTWHIFFMPQVSILIDFELDPTLSTIAIFLLLVQSFINLYFNRATKFLHNNPFIRKYTNLTIVSIAIDTLCYMNFQFYLIRLILLHFSTIVQIVDVYSFHPYKPKLNSFVFQCAILQYTLIFITTISIIQKSENNLFYSYFLFGSFSVALSQILIEKCSKKQTFDQYFILVQSQSLYLASNIQKAIMISQHRQICKFKHENNVIETIICILENSIKKNKQIKLDYEILELALINFLSLQKAALTAFCRLKMYYNAIDDHTIYFQICFPNIDKKLWKRVRDVQNRITKQIRSTSYYDEKDLKTKDIYVASLMKDQFYPKIIEVLNRKLEYWNQLLSDLANYERLFEHTIKCSQVVHNFNIFLQNLFSQDLDEIQNVKTVIELKMLEIYFCVVRNDQVQATKMQKLIIEMLRQETQQDGKLLNCSIMENKVVLLYTSIVKAQGFIIKTNSDQLAKFWGYESELDFHDIKHINQLMPNFCASVHDQYIERFQMLGHSILFGKCRTIFLKDKYDLLIPASITIDNFFISYDDYVITAAFAKNKETSLYILFDCKGKILGVTQLMYKVFHTIDSTVTPELLNTGYIFQIIPNIFYLVNNHTNAEFDNILYEERIHLIIGNPIKQQFEKPINLSKHKGYYDDLWTLYEDTKNHKTEMFLQDYQDSCKQFIDHQLKTVDFEIICQLHYQIIGHYKTMPMFTLEILDIIKADQQSSQIYSSDIEIKTNDIFEPDPVDLSSIQEESFQKVKNNDLPQFDNQLQQVPDISFIKGRFEQQLNEQTPKNNKQKQSIMQPQSQKATFQVIKQKSLNDDLKSIEEEMKIIKANKRYSQRQIILNEKQKEEHKSSEKLTKRKNIIDQIQEKRKQDINEMDAVNSVNSIASNLINYKQDLVKSVYKSNKIPYSLKMIIIFDLMIISSILFFNIFPIITIHNNNIHAIEQIDAIMAPYLYNSYYCQLYVHNMIFELQKLSIVNYSQELIHDIESINQNNTLLQDLKKYYPVFLEIEKLDYFPKLNINFINTADQLNVSFTYMYSVLIEKLQYFTQKGQNFAKYQMNESEIISSLYLYANLQESISLYSDLIQLIVLTFFEDMVYDENTFLKYLIVALFVIIFLFWIQIIYFHQIFNYFKKIIYLNCRLLEKDVHLIVQRLQLIREILIEHTVTNWKKADYVHLMFQQIKSDQIQIQSKINKHTLLCSRIAQSKFSLLSILIMIVSVQSLLIGFCIGGYFFNEIQQIELTPQYELMSQFFQFSVTMDSMVTQSIRVKCQRLYMQNNKINESITVQKTLVNSKLLAIRTTNLTFYSILYQDFVKSEELILKGLINDQTVDRQNNSTLYQLFFNDLCPIICPNSTDERDMNKYYVSEGISGIYASLSKFIKSSFNYELENLKQDPDIKAQISVVNSHEFIVLFSRHFINTKKAFRKFQEQILNKTYKVIEKNDQEIQAYFSCALLIEIIIAGITFIYCIKMKQYQIQLMRLSLCSIPIDLLDQQSISILKTL
ncbi:unnamed protein product [Paramecium pentaurelia]|uniref:Transmembrane protein n=1 Tax=Paramecium pentaurelia TaxID=43138 RepID=A0A8S1WMG8_9CILI|nr:unnamed protein product [Paramecium pentaurelia]